jgi:hypothetical protein
MRKEEVGDHRDQTLSIDGMQQQYGALVHRNCLCALCASVVDYPVAANSRK